MVPSVLSHTPTCVSLHRGHLQCAKGAGHYGKENTKTCLGVMAAICRSLYVYQLRNGERAVALSADQLIALAALSYSMFRKQKMQLNLQLMGLFHSLFTQDSALSQESLSVQQRRRHLVSHWEGVRWADGSRFLPFPDRNTNVSNICVVEA